jgi:hypothetical protein
MDRQARTHDTVLVKSREMTCVEAPELALLAGGRGKDDRTKYICPIALDHLNIIGSTKKKQSLQNIYNSSKYFFEAVLFHFLLMIFTYFFFSRKNLGKSIFKELKE